MPVQRNFRDLLAQAEAVTPKSEPESVAPRAEPEAAEPKPELKVVEPAAVAAAPEAPAPAASPAAAEVPVSAPAAAPVPEVVQESPAVAKVESSGPARPHWSQLMRKEVRLFKGQDIDLKVLTMEIQAKRTGVEERLTDNTLVRIAIDLLLQRKDELKGSTEAELRESLNLPPRY